MLVASIYRHGIRGQPNPHHSPRRRARKTTLHVSGTFVRESLTTFTNDDEDTYLSYSDVSRNSEISLQSYLRKEEPKRGADDDMGNDVFLGGIKFTPDFDNISTQDQWYELNGGSGKILVGVSFQPSSVRSPFHFVILAIDLSFRDTRLPSTISN